ncbi:zinc-binding oxidoreductase CipB [Xylaria bambusicola]|uniref:zinc-binding oxidoreductase CipB n=1 Tax=Xylaria bambusicola TaxID=326684 RepID=UPI0020084558|nr:zinc-binding oxidoreductase CipB [Xylaria bambusicola]KAI0521286.1 zinc-binding oxidoreductase CipB [Xylaria bambusicola]
MPPNQAAWLTAAQTQSLEVNGASMGRPQESQSLVKNRAIAINPIDGILQRDVAGEIVEVGPNVSKLAKGFQAYTILEANITYQVPDDMPWEKAVVIPTGSTTAACALFHPEFLDSQLPGTGVRERHKDVGRNAIQVAMATGYEVMTTSPPKNFKFVKGLGTSHVFDYASEQAIEQCVQLAQMVEGVKCIASMTGGFSAPPSGVKVGHVYGPIIAEIQIAEAIYYVLAPEPLIVGNGLGSI